MITFAVEPLADFLLQSKPLFEAHYQEIAWRKEKIALEPDYAQYQVLADARRLIVVTARTPDAVLIGYALWFVMPHLHYKSTMFAYNDILYIAPEYRKSGAGRDLLRFSEVTVLGFDVKVLTLHIKNCLDWSPLAASEGYEAVESTHMKWIGD
jgi:hypothetical protein